MRRKYTDYGTKDGFSLIEVLIAITILGIGIAGLIQLFSGSLRTVGKSGEHSRATIHARSLLDEAYAAPDIAGVAGTFDLSGGFRAERSLREVSSEDGVSVYEITVSVNWPSGHVELKGKKAVREKKKM